MIITPTTRIDNDHMNAFQHDFAEYNKCRGPQTAQRGHGDLAGLSIAVKHTRTLQGNGLLVAVSDRNEGILICRLIAAPVPQGALPWGRKIYVMDRIRVHEDYVGRGLAPHVYHWLSENGYTIMSDSHQNSNSLAVWHKLGKRGGVFTVNIEDGTWRPYDPTKIEDWMIFGNNDPVRYWPIRLVLPCKG
jgi:GNAT superfamily N-acetyltransferase